MDASDHAFEEGLDVLPAGLPAYELSTPTGYEEDRVGRVHWQRATFETYRGAQIVRRHYRDLLVERGWRIISNDPVRDGAALIVASTDTREVTVRITPKGAGVEISVAVTEIQSASRPPEADPFTDPSLGDATSARDTTRSTTRVPSATVAPDRTVARPAARSRPPLQQDPDRPRPRPAPQPAPEPAPKASKIEPKPKPG